ncbi:MAG: FAD-dependent oxidoreductase [Vicinamibacterales bacterium]
MTRKRVVVIGNGMAGARLVEELVSRGANQKQEIVVFGDEPYGNYNRILLSGVMAGARRPEDIVINPIRWYASNGIDLRTGVRIAGIDPVERRITTASGETEAYDSLVLATGSRPLLPPIEGLVAESDGDQKPLRRGVFVFRTLDDCDQIAAWTRHARRAVVIGGGLLGLEAAKGLRDRGLDVHVVHLAPHLMEVQLDREAGRILRHRLERFGMTVSTNTSTSAILGNGKVTGVAFADGSSHECDMVIVAAGIRPNVELARAAGLEVSRGIVVGDDLATRPYPDISAIGECAEHRGRLYGIVAPLWEQARVLADRLSGRAPDAAYVGSRPSTKLKVAGIDLAVMGINEPVDDDDEVVTYSEPSRGVYKKLIVRAHRLVGAIVLGDPDVVPSLVQAYADGRPLAERRSDSILPPATLAAGEPVSPDQLPDNAQICDCNAVTKAQIVEAVLAGATSLQAVCDATRASTGCGSCRPEVERIVSLARRGVTEPAMLASPPAVSATESLERQRSNDADSVVVTLNKVERIKQEKEGLEILSDVPALARIGWQAIPEGDRERLKWTGVFFRRQTPGRFMMRIRIPNGCTSDEQLQAIAGISEEFGSGSIDITTRQQLQVRGFGLEHTEEIWRRLDQVGLVSLQTGMDNIRNVIGCAVAGLTDREIVDASPIVREFTALFLRNREFTNLPRKFNVGISGCTESCVPMESQDLALTPAVRVEGGRQVAGFNVAVGGKMGSGGCRIATPLDVFVEPDEAVEVCADIVRLFRDHGARGARNRARLSFLLESWGAPRFRRELEQRAGRTLSTAGRDAHGGRSADHVGVVRQKQAGLNYVGMVVPVGRISAAQMRTVASLAAAYGSGDIRLTTSQNVVIAGVPDHRLQDLLREPLLEELPCDPHGALRGLVACTGIDYCHFALIETKELAMRTARHLAGRLPDHVRFRTHWSGCPAGCGNHAAADIGLLGKNIRVNGQIVEAVDVFVGGRAGSSPRAATRVFEDVPCDELPQVLERIAPYAAGPRARGEGRPAAAVTSGGRDVQAR